jgi:hypothetical protein
VEQKEMAKYKEDYTFVTDKEENQVCVGVVGGKYDGVVYKYGKVTVPDENEENEEGNLPFQFEYDIVDSNGLPRSLFEIDFNERIGDILVDIITNESNN